MRAMILAAGFGTRLKPLTDTLPKAMIRINGIPIIGIIIRRLVYYGFTDIIINLHYLPDEIVSYVKSLNLPGVRFYFSHEKEKILDTGGGIKFARELLDNGQHFLVHNVDVISNIDLNGIYHFHQSAKAMATLAVKGKNSHRSLLFDRDWLLAGWENSATGESRIIRLPANKMFKRIGFCGIHVISPAIFDLMQTEKVFSIINTYMQIGADQKIIGFPVEDNLWLDIGSHQQLEEANRIDPAKYLP
jgi:NDP-sugar pyrophosphorylase family protein